MTMPTQNVFIARAYSQIVTKAVKWHKLAHTDCVDSCVIRAVTVKDKLLKSIILN
jgi:hypothetical protein